MESVMIILLGVSMLYIFAAGRIEAFVYALAAQGLLLFLLVLADIREVDPLNLVLLGFETLVIKAVAIPYLLLRVIRRNEISREMEPYLSQFYSLLIGVGIYIFGFAAAFWSADADPIIKPLYFCVSLAMIISSLFLIVNRKRIITHILCFMALENGIFLLSLSVVDEMPMLVNAGVLLDLFVGVYLFVIFLNKIQAMYDGDHIDVISELKD